jgi:hypothetical protein
MHPISVIILLIQAGLGSASIISLANDAVTWGLSFMFALFLMSLINRILVGRRPNGARINSH